MSHLKCPKFGGEHAPCERALLCPERDYGRLDIHCDYQEAKKVLDRKTLEGRRGGLWKNSNCFLRMRNIRQEWRVGVPRCTRLGGGNVVGPDHIYMKERTGLPRQIVFHR